MDTTPLSLEAIHDLAFTVLAANGCDAANAAAVAGTVTAAERDGARSHGLFRMPGYVAALRNGRVRGDAAPSVQLVTPAFLRVDGAGGFAPLALERGLPALADAARKLGVAVMTINDCYHFAALWPEAEALADWAIEMLDVFLADGFPLAPELETKGALTFAPQQNGSHILLGGLRGQFLLALVSGPDTAATLAAWNRVAEREVDGFLEAG